MALASADGGAPDLSVVTTLYRSEPYIREFYGRMVASALQVSPSFEIVFVDDGSPDQAASIARELVARDPRVKLVELSRNFGHHRAALAGLQHARGRRVFIIDVDLEEQPEWLPEFAAEFDRTGADVVYGQSVLRRGSLFRRWSGAAFWKLFNLMSETKVPPNPCTVRLLGRRYLEALFTLPDRALFLAGSYAWAGFRQVARPVEKRVRPTRSNYSLARLLDLFVEAVTSFTSYPLKLILLVGVAIAGAAVLAGLGLIVRKLLYPETITMGWPSIMVSIWFLGGTMIAFLGVIGMYIAKVFVETKGRPVYLVREVHVSGAAPDGSGG
ncbi:MAG TPA: glycosyltransferase family 2 protein [Vicinamibacteria bacterium]|nr:glycosyltransferase family 2 protein [Vicinamibacteria bacterium]